MAISISRELSFLQQLPAFGSYLSQALLRLQNGINHLGEHVQVDPAGTMPPPPPISSLTVKSNGAGLVHAVISDNSSINKNLHYFVEYSTDPNFAQPHVKQLSASRSMEPIVLPALDDNNVAQKFYFRAYSQYQGGLPGEKINFGGTVPQAVDPGGTQAMTLLPSTGSGTAQNTGQEGGSGFGKILKRTT